MEIDRAGLAGFLRRRRATLQPEDVGLPRGTRRRTAGLRREEVAELGHMSADYYARLEQGRGPLPSEALLAALADGLRLRSEEREHLFRLAGHNPPRPEAPDEAMSPGLLRIFDRLHDTPAEVVTELAHTLQQSPLARELFGDASQFEGPERSHGYRWFASPEVRERYAPEDHERMSRMFVSGLRELAALRGPDSHAAAYARQLSQVSGEFRALWARHEVGVRPDATKRIVHPEMGIIELNCQTLLDPDRSHSLLVYTATPATPSEEKLESLAVRALRRSLPEVAPLRAR